MRQFIQIHPSDNVAVALTTLKAGLEVGDEGFTLIPQTEIPRGHKCALCNLAEGETIIKYGFPIGQATQPISAGQWVHTHNTRMMLGKDIEYHYRPAAAHASSAESGQPRGGAAFNAQGARGRTFLGYPRASGRTGTRNEIWIINTVACVNNSAEKIARLAHERFADDNLEGVYSFPHPYGCSQLGDDLKNTQRVLAGLIRHPNAGGVLVLGLGCENNAIKYFVNELGGYDPQRVKFLNAQDVNDEVEEGLKIVEGLARSAARFKRQPCPISELTVGMKCGGSDGLSGITANPLVGRISDILSDCDGTAILSEVPEMFGAEQVLMNRAKDEATFHRIVAMIDSFKDYYRRHGQPIYENPSPGNKEGGITTLEEKSLGAIQKGGRAIVRQVLRYGEPVTESGLVLLEAPGNDGISATAEAVSGANLILFTTGRGTPLGVPVPTVKLSTNTELAMRKPQWIDYDAGVLANGDISFDDAATDLLDFVVRVASGEIRTRNELNGFREITIFKTGVTL